MTKKMQCGTVALIGRPNVGKSTLLNQILGQKVSITARKPQTTRQRILGIKTQGQVQTIFVDTPGIHSNAPRALNRYMNRVAQTSMRSVDVIVFMVNVLKWDSEDDRILQRFQGLDCPVILVVNKVDKIADKALLLAYLQELSAKMNFAAIIPLSAKTGDNVANLTDLLTEYLPQSPHCYPPDCVSDRSERFLAAEIIREKIIRSLGQEVPFCTTVAIDSLQTTAKLIRLSATIWVERDGQKAIVIGKGGLRLKMIGKTARLELEKIFNQKVFLELWVKVKSGWSDDERALISLGYYDH
jgi:GTPase